MPGIKTLLARAKRKLFEKPFLKDPAFPAFWFDKSLSAKAASLVQIGSNDGKTGDPLYPLLQKNKNWKALFVEPVPYSFEKLQNNYPDKKRFQFENVAINDGTQLTFYWVDHKAKQALPDLPYWYDQLGSFDRQHILNHLDGALEPFILSANLEGLTLQQLFDRNEIKEIDILHIDTEGYDWKILSQLNLKKYQPAFILFEYNHLAKDELNAAIAMLNPQYKLFNLGIDLLAVHAQINEKWIDKMTKKMSPMQTP